MNEEEKKAIDDLFALTHINGYIDLYKQHQARIYTSDLSKWQNGVKTLLNLIEKQQKEIKNLAEKQNELIDDYENELLEKNNYIFQLENEREVLYKLIDEEMG